MTIDNKKNKHSVRFILNSPQITYKRFNGNVEWYSFQRSKYKKMQNKILCL